MLCYVMFGRLGILFLPRGLASTPEYPLVLVAVGASWSTPAHTHSNHLASMCISLIIISKQVRWQEKVVTLVDNLNHQVEDRLEL